MTRQCRSWATGPARHHGVLQSDEGRRAPLLLRIVSQRLMMQTSALTQFDPDENSRDRLRHCAAVFFSRPLTTGAGSMATSPCPRLVLQIHQRPYLRVDAAHSKSGGGASRRHRRAFGPQPGQHGFVDPRSTPPAIGSRFRPASTAGKLKLLVARSIRPYTELTIGIGSEPTETTSPCPQCSPFISCLGGTANETIRFEARDTEPAGVPFAALSMRSCILRLCSSYFASATFANSACGAEAISAN